MADRSHTEEYERARSAFDQLKIDDRAVFLIEATVSTIAHGLDQAGKAASQILDDLFKARRPEGEAETGGPTSAPPPSEDVPPHRADAPDAHTET